MYNVLEIYQYITEDINESNLTHTKKGLPRFLSLVCSLYNVNNVTYLTKESHFFETINIKQLYCLNFQTKL